MAKQSTPKKKPAATKKPTRAAAKKSAPKKAASEKAAATKAATKKPATKKSTSHMSAAQKLAKAATPKPAKKTPAKRKSKEPSVLTAKKNKTKPTAAKTASNRRKTAPHAEGYLSKAGGWGREAVAGLRRMMVKAAPAKEVAGESLGWIKSQATRVKEVGQKELHELVRVASKLKELRGTPAAVTGKRKTKQK